MTRRDAVRTLSALLAAPLGCGRGGERVVVYAALDREFSEPILTAYARKTGVDVAAKYDVESTKTVGLVSAIVAEKARPRCDLFWNNEILNTIRLQDQGLLQPFDVAAAPGIAPAFKAADNTWYGLAARARVLLINVDAVKESDIPRGLNDLIDPRRKNRIGLAKPLFGTTATHAACLFAAWGDEAAKRYFRALKANGAQVFSGNKNVAQAVGEGRIDVGLTDTDDAIGEVDAGRPVAILYPDRDAGQLGTLFLPNTLAIPKGAPNAASARILAEHLLSPEVETALARGPSAQIPLGAGVDVIPRVETPKTVATMRVDFRKAAEAWARTMEFLAAEFGGA